MSEHVYPLLSFSAFACVILSLVLKGKAQRIALLSGSNRVAGLVGTEWLTATNLRARRYRNGAIGIFVGGVAVIIMVVEVLAHQRAVLFDAQRRMPEKTMAPPAAK